ncbi:hypothetical protein [Persephonella sp.]
MRLSIFLFTFVIFFSTVSQVFAIPSFARQMTATCSTCHSQNQFPALNSFGRSFKAGAFTMVGDEKLITEEDMFVSLPAVLNASFVVKVRYVKEGGATGDFQFPDEAAILIGGRVSDFIGSFIEIGYDSVDKKFLLANFKMPFVFDFYGRKFGIVPFTTDAFGPSFAFEILNTGAVRNQRVVEDRNVVSAQQYIGTATEAQGVGFYIYDDLYSFVYAGWGPAHGSVKLSKTSHYVRIVFTPQLGSWDVGFGGQLWSGKTEVKDNKGSKSEFKTNAYAVDFQAMGELIKPVTFIITYGNAKNEKNSLYNTGSDNKNAFTFLSEIAVVPDRLMISGGLRNAKDENGSKDNAGILVFKYMINRNVELQFDYTRFFDRDVKNKYLFMLYAAF